MCSRINCNYIPLFKIVVYICLIYTLAMQHADLSSPTRDGICITCIEKQILNHPTTREVPRSWFTYSGGTPGALANLVPCDRTLGRRKHLNCISVLIKCVSHSVVPNSSRPHGLLPARLPCPWDFPGKHTGAGCHFLLRGLGTRTPVSCIAGRFFTSWAVREAQC